MAENEATIKVRIGDEAKRKLRGINQAAAGVLKRGTGGITNLGGLSQAVISGVQRSATGGFGDLIGGALGPTMEALKAFPDSRIIATAKAMNQPSGFFRAAAMETTPEGRERIARRALHSFDVNVRRDSMRMQGMRRFALLSEFAGPGAEAIEAGLKWLLAKGEEIKKEFARNK